MKRKPREPDQHYWLDLPTREPLSFCQANSAPTSLPYTPDPTSPSLFPSFRLFLFLRHGCSNLVLRLGTHWAVAMVTGKLFAPCASKGTFPLLEFLPLPTGQSGSFSFACQSTCFALKEGKSSVAYNTCCVPASTVLWWEYLRVSCTFQYVALLFFPRPSHFWSKRHLSRHWNTTQRHDWFFLFQYRIASEKIPKICLEVILLPFLQAWKSTGKDFVRFLFQGLLKGLFFCINRMCIFEDVHLSRT